MARVCKRRNLTPLRAHTLLLLAALLGPTLSAQASRETFVWGLSGGLSTHSGSDELSRLGPTASVFVRRPASPRLSFRLEALITNFSHNSDVIYGPCAPPPEPCSAPGYAGPLTVGALATTLHWDDSIVAAGNTGSYLVLGGGVYRSLRHPTAPGATRLGWTAGFGFLLSRAEPRLAIEVRYHQIPRWPGDRISLIPVALALSW